MRQGGKGWVVGWGGRGRRLRAPLEDRDLYVGGHPAEAEGSWAKSLGQETPAPHHNLGDVGEPARSGPV